MKYLIKFKWAIKRLRRQRSNYDILEGFFERMIDRRGFKECNQLTR